MLNFLIGINTWSKRGQNNRCIVIVYKKKKKYSAFLLIFKDSNDREDFSSKLKVYRLILSY